MANEGLKDVSVAQRQIYILSLLSENHKGFTANDIVERLKNWDIQVTKRTVTRDLDELSLNYCIFEDERDGQSYFYADKYNLKDVDITIPEMFSIVFMEKMANEYQETQIGRDALRMLNKIKESTGTINQMHMKEFASMIQNLDEKKIKRDLIKPETEDAIRQAIDSKWKVKITYHSYSGDEDTVRVIWPMNFTMIDGYLNVEAYCELRGSVRRFRLSRMSSVEVLDKHFTITDELKEKVDSSFNKLKAVGELQDIKIYFDKDAARYVKEYESHLADRISKYEDGILFERQVAVSDEIVKWILGFGASAKVLEPDTLKARLEEETKKLFDLYH